MTYEIQTVWETWFAVYLFLGGMGAAMIAVVVSCDMFRVFQKEYHKLVAWGVLLGNAFLSMGSSLLFLHLLDHLAVINVLNPLVLFRQPNAWIAWGTQFIVWIMVWSMLYALPYLQVLLSRFPMALVRKLVNSGVANMLVKFSQKFKYLFGWLAILCGVGTVMYTGLLMQSFPAVMLWHNPGIPALFAVSGFSTALAFLLLLQYLLLKEDDHELRAAFERIDLGLIVMELLLVFYFFNYLLVGSESGYRTMDLLWGDWGWLIGFVLFGLVVPLLLELGVVSKKVTGHAPVVVAAFLVLMGGYLLRHYVLVVGGVFEYPW